MRLCCVLLTVLAFVLSLVSCCSSCNCREGLLNSYLWQVESLQAEPEFKDAFEQSYPTLSDQPIQQKRGGRAYFFGTLHSPVDEVWPCIPENVRAAFRSSTRALFELDMTDPRSSTKLSSCHTLPAGATVDTVLSPALYHLLKTRMQFLEDQLASQACGIIQGSSEGLGGNRGNIDSRFRLGRGNREEAEKLFNLLESGGSRFRRRSGKKNKDRGKRRRQADKRRKAGKDSATPTPSADLLVSAAYHVIRRTASSGLLSMTGAGSWTRKHPMWIVNFLRSILDELKETEDIEKVEKPHPLGDTLLNDEGVQHEGPQSTAGGCAPAGAGSTVPSLDLYLTQQAVKWGKTVGSLETVEEHCSVVRGSSLGQVFILLNRTLSSMEDLATADLQVTRTGWSQSNSRMQDDPVLLPGTKDKKKNGKRRSHNVKVLKDTITDDSEQRVNGVNRRDNSKVVRNRILSSDSVGSTLSQYACGHSGFGDTSQSVGRGTGQVKQSAVDQPPKDRLFSRRNWRIARRAAAVLRNNSDTSFFFAVGAGHFFGSGSIVEWMKKEGYSMRRLPTTEHVENVMGPTEAFSNFRDLARYSTSSIYDSPSLKKVFRKLDKLGRKQGNRKGNRKGTGFVAFSLPDVAPARGSKPAVSATAVTVVTKRVIQSAASTRAPLFQMTSQTSLHSSSRGSVTASWIGLPYFCVAAFVIKYVLFL